MQTLPKQLTRQSPSGISQRWIKSTPDNITVCSSLESLCLLWSCSFSATDEGAACTTTAGGNSRLCGDVCLIPLSRGLDLSQVFLGTGIKYYGEKKCVSSQRMRCRCVSPAAALQGSHSVGLHCPDVAHKQYKQQEHWKRVNVPDFGPKQQGERHDLTVGWHHWKLYLTVVTLLPETACVTGDL